MLKRDLSGSLFLYMLCPDELNAISGNQKQPEWYKVADFKQWKYSRMLLLWMLFDKSFFWGHSSGIKGVITVLYIQQSLASELGLSSEAIFVINWLTLSFLFYSKETLMNIQGQKQTLIHFFFFWFLSTFHRRAFHNMRH